MTKIVNFRRGLKGKNLNNFLDKQAMEGEDLLQSLSKKDRYAVYDFLFRLIFDQVHIGLGISGLSEKEIEEYKQKNGMALFEMIDIIYKEAINAPK